MNCVAELSRAPLFWTFGELCTTGMVALSEGAMPGSETPRIAAISCPRSAGATVLTTSGTGNATNPGNAFSNLHQGQFGAVEK
jgi:hypothetical protein